MDKELKKQKNGEYYIPSESVFVELQDKSRKLMRKFNSEPDKIIWYKNYTKGVGISQKTWYNHFVIKKGFPKMSKNDSTSFGIGILAGILGGITLGVLFAPKPGEETRKELKEAACKIAEENGPKLKKVKEDAKNGLEILRCKLENKYNKFNSKIKAKKMAKAKSKEEDNYEFN